MIIASIAGIFISAPVFQFVLASITAILFSGFVLYDVQQVKYARADADPILLAIDIYLDMLNLFLALLRVITYFSSDDELLPESLGGTAGPVRAGAAAAPPGSAP